jgi:(p)ppGpp synthase/HD superfamily hydrolase
MTHLAHAIEIAAEAHQGQTDKTGRPYFEHCRRVAEAVGTIDEKIVAYLHDVVEKGSGWSFAKLEAAGLSPAVVAAVYALTKDEGEDDCDFVRRAAANPLARPVKKADLEDNRRQAIAAGMPTGKYDEGLAILREESAKGSCHGQP